MSSTLLIDNSNNIMNTACNNEQQAQHSRRREDEEESDVEDTFIPFPPKVAAKARFPPQCPILVVIGTDKATAASLSSSTTAAQGVVVQVGINMDDDDRKNHYKIQLQPQQKEGEQNATTMVIVPEQSLYLTTGAPVWLYKPTTTTASTEPSFDKAVVIGTARLPTPTEASDDTGLVMMIKNAQRMAMYYHSVQIQCDDTNKGSSSHCRVCHGVLPHHVLYRTPNSLPPTKAPKGPKFMPSMTSPQKDDRVSLVSSLSSVSSATEPVAMTTTTTPVSSGAYDGNGNTAADRVERPVVSPVPSNGGSFHRNTVNKSVAVAIPPRDLSAPRKRVSMTSVTSDTSTFTTDSHKNDSDSVYQNQQGKTASTTPKKNSSGATTEFARIVSVLHTPSQQLHQPLLAIGFKKTAAERDNSTKRVIKRRRVSIEEDLIPKKKQGTTDDLMPVIPRKPKKLQSSSSPLVAEQGEMTTSIDEWVTYAASLPASSTQSGIGATNKHCTKMESPLNHHGGITMETIDDEDDGAPHAVAITRRPYSNTGYGRLINPNPPVFQTILVAPGNHSLKAAIHGLRQLRCGGVGNVVFNSCLSWQLEGVCRANCLRAKYHVPLTPCDASKLEEALLPVVSSTGPILCKLVGGGSNASLDYYSGTNRKLKVENYSNNINGFQADPQSQGSTVLFSANPSVPTLDNLQAPVTSRFRLPTFFGTSFLVDVMSLVGAQLCDKYACSIRIEGGGAIGGRYVPLLLFVTGTNVQDVNLCWSYIQHDALAKAVPASLRRNMLFQLGKLNGSRDYHNDMVKTRNPFPSQSEHEEFHWLAMLKAGKFSKPDMKVLAMSQVLSMEKLLEDTFPTCLVEVVDPWKMLDTNGRPLFAHLYPHVIVRFSFLVTSAFGN